MADQSSVVNSLPQSEEAPAKRDSRYLRPDEFLRDAIVAVSNAKSNPEIMQEISQYGYDEVRMAEGTGLLSRVTELNARHNQEYGEQLEASAVFQNLFKKGRSVYVKSVKFARQVFEKDSKAWEALVLSGDRSQLFSRWRDQALRFYDNILSHPEYISGMEYFGYTQEKLRGELALVNEVVEANNRHKQEKGESQEATKLRDQAFEELEAWMSKFYTMVKIALGEKSQWLEKLGIMQP